MPKIDASSSKFLHTISFSLVMLSIGFVAGFLTERQLVARGATGVIVGQLPPPEGVDFSPVWKAWNVVDQKFVPAAIASSTKVATTTADINQERVWGLIAGLAASLQDPYTFFLPPQENKDFAAGMSGSFDGIGMEIAVKNEMLTVVAPLKGNPAEKAGIKSGDLVVKINGESTKGMDVSVAVSKIRGKKGTTVKIHIQREGWAEPREFAIVRDVIVVPIVNTKKLDSGIFLISVATFTSNAPELFRNALREFSESGTNMLILDLRGNPGGYLEAAVNMASWFLPPGKVIVTEDYSDHSPNVAHRSLGYDVFNKNLKMAILVDKGSASASEILADALRHYGVAKLVGTATFGKGSVQELVEITPETSLKITVARWLGPDGKQIPIDGILPDIVSTTTEALVKDGKDVQLEAAVRYLNSL
jgi:carboxyl-terminal processing protease